MTEEDTFRKLVQVPYEEMSILWMATDIGVSDRHSFFLAHGWVYEEFVKVNPKDSWYTHD